VKAGEAHDMADDQLVEFVGNAREELFNLRFQHATGALENPAALSRVKRDIARMLTLAHERAAAQKVQTS
jgi:large subunit ribosomal protein L29